MEKMFSRFRSMSGTKLKSPTVESQSAMPAAPPSKEDILSTLDGFGEKIQDPNTREDNNNVHIRRNSSTSVCSDNNMDINTCDTEPTITSITHSYSLEWEKLFMKQGYLRHLRNYAMKGNLRSSRFRSISWKLFLGVLPEDSSLWIAKTKQMRSKYKDLKDKLIVNPRKAVDTVDLSFNNPLSQEDESPWNRFFLDNELRLTIKQDVIRTYPRIQFFQSNQLRNLMVDILFIYAKQNPDVSYRQGLIANSMDPDETAQMRRLIWIHAGRKCTRCTFSPELFEILRESFPEIQFYHSEDVRDLMVNTLFCYCREHPSLSYKQGMHELLAPMIFVLHCDHQAFLHASELESLDEKIKCLLDPKFLEHDAYAMFSQAMQTMEPWYVSKEVYPTKNTDPTSSQPFARPQDLNPSNVIVTKLTRIQDYLLKKTDLELHMHLERHEIAPQIYGIRWIRLLFGREFPMQDLLVLWDAIFADGIGFDLVDYIFVAMLLYLRDHLLSSDYPSCLITLMRYPPVGDIHFFIDRARHLRDPHQYPRPPKCTYQSVQTAEKFQPQQPKADPKPQSSNTLQSFTRKIYSSSRPKSLTVRGRQKMSKSSSEPMNLQTDISPESPTPGNVPQHKRGSSASLSHVEDSMFRSTQSSGSLTKYETQSLRSAATTPEDVSVNGSPTRYATMPNRGKTKQKKVAVDSAAEAEIAALRGVLNDKESMCNYCASKLDHHIDRLQAQFLRQSLENEDEILVAIAGIKQVRDVLKGTLRFSQNLLDEDEISINYNHYNMDVSSSSSPDTDSSPGFVVSEPIKDKAAERRLFYVSSEENSEAIDSPSEPVTSVATNQTNPNINFKLPARDYEMEDLRNDRRFKHSKYKDYKGQFRGSGPNQCESDFSKSWSADSSRTDTSPESAEEDSPNPLYRIRHSSYDL